jgi:hypothetical protein
MGQVLASVTHEMQNVMAIIKESGALVDDILELNGRPRLEHGDKLESGLLNVREQVDRGRRLMLMLNGFAHAAADYPERCDLPRFARQICVPADRAARMKEGALRPELGAGSVLARGNALLIMESVWTALNALLAGCAKGDVLTVSIAPKTPADTGPVLLIAAETSRGTPDLTALEPLMAQLGAHCRARPGAAELCFAGAEEGDQA